MRVLLILLTLSATLPAADGTLVVQITDQATGRPLAARISLKPSDGRRSQRSASIERL